MKFNLMCGEADVSGGRKSARPVVATLQERVMVELDYDEYLPAEQLAYNDGYATGQRAISELERQLGS